MEVRLEKRYPLGVDPARAWKLLRDVRATAGCMPGAEITGQVDETHYAGNVKVKVGPATAAFAGDIEVKALDEATRTLQLLGKGADRGGSTASMDLTATVEPGDTPADAVLVGQAVVVVNGKFAQFGGRMMVQVSDMLLAQFADRFRAAAASLPAAQPAGVPAGDAATGEPPAFAADAAAREAIAAPVADATPAPVPPQRNEINALAILWGLLKGWLAGLFGRRA